jgi:hypothetical protein
MGIAGIVVAVGLSRVMHAPCPPDSRESRWSSRPARCCSCNQVTRSQQRSEYMTWIKPEFEFVDLCSEVTSYLFHR